jgi:hypothetical protein
MMMSRHRPGRGATALLAGLLALVMPDAGLVFSRPAAAQPSIAAVQLPPPPPGLARVWFLRQYEPGESLATPWIYINGQPLTTSQPGTIFYRDLAPGTYAFTVDTCGRDVNQFQTLTLAPGSRIELEIQSLSSFTPPDCPVPETFYVRPVAPRFLQLYLPQLAYLGAR